ncbi:MAG: hypothetical protein EA408_12525 [Marinilabiliales bacterium]|nr:MAG: hypothetical protein EA408_12525 [Marinilabiliales bacterium]
MTIGWYMQSASRFSECHGKDRFPFGDGADLQASGASSYPLPDKHLYNFASQHLQQDSAQLPVAGEAADFCIRVYEVDFYYKN